MYLDQPRWTKGPWFLDLSGDEYHPICQLWGCHLVMDPPRFLWSRFIMEKFGSPGHTTGCTLRLTQVISMSLPGNVFLFLSRYKNTPLKSVMVQGAVVVYHLYATSWAVVSYVFLLLLPDIFGLPHFEAGRVLLPQCPQGCSLQDSFWMSDLCHKRACLNESFGPALRYRIWRKRFLNWEKSSAHVHTSSAVVLETCASSNLLPSCKWFSIGVTALWE